MRVYVLLIGLLGSAACTGSVKDDTAIKPSECDAPGLWYTDNDGDGYGAGEATQSCEAPSGLVGDGDDCDDEDATVYPGALEVCNDGLLNDCDADPSELSDACRLPDAVDLETEADCHLSGGTRYDELGASLADVGDVNGDGHADLLVGAKTGSSEDLDLPQHGAIFLMSGPLNGAEALDTAAAAVYGESMAGAFGQTVASAGDVDGDGYNDMIVGEPYNSDTSTAGVAWLIEGPLSGVSQVQDIGVALTGEHDLAYTGYAVSMMAGTDEGGVLITAKGWGGEGVPGAYAGAVYVVLRGQIEDQGAGSAWSLSGAHARITAENDGDYAGVAASGRGDVNGDGVGDVLVGAPGEDSVSFDGGAAYLHYGPVSGLLSLADADHKWTGEADSDRAGNAVSFAGDVDGDGLDDLLIGAPFVSDAEYTHRGTAYLITGAGSRGLVTPLGDATASLLGWDDEALTGSSLWGPGDVDGDGYGDALVGAPGARNPSGASAGAAMLAYGPLSGSLHLNGVGVTGLLGWDDEALTGGAVSGSADLNGDHVPDLLVGAQQASGYAGSAYVVFGGGL